MAHAGSVIAVETEYASVQLAAVASASDTSIVVDSVESFPPSGTLRLQGLDPTTADDVGEDVDYTSADGDTLVISLSSPLTNDYDVDGEVFVLPLVPKTWATIQTDPDDEPTRAFVPENLKTTYKPAFDDGDYASGTGAEVVVEEIGVPTIVKVVGVPSLLDGGAVDPGSTIPPGALTDGNPPADAPTDVATVGGLNLIFVKWTPIANADPVKYDVHVSASAGFTPDSTTLLVEGATGSMVPAKTLADGTPFDYDTVYHFKVIATDADGQGPASAEVTGQMNRTGTDDIVVGSITADKLEAILILVTKIATALGGQRIELDTDGIRSYDPSGDLLVDWSSATGLMTWRSSADGERVELDQNGVSTYTDSAVMVHYDNTSQTCIAARGDAYFGCTQSSLLLDYDKDTFESTSVPAGGFTISKMAVNATHVFAVDLTNSDIRKFTHAGSSVGSGFPIVGTFTNVATDDTTLFAIDGSSDIRKYSASTGVENTSGFPIAGTFTKIAVNSTHIYALQNGDIYKYDKATGAQVVSGFPIAASFDSIAADDTYVYAGTAVDGYVLRYTTAGAAASSSDGFPILDTVSDLAVGNDHLLAMRLGGSGGLAFYNVSDAALSARLDAATGLLTGPGIDVTNVRAALVQATLIEGSLSTNLITTPDGSDPIQVVADTEFVGDVDVSGTLTAPSATIDAASIPSLGHSDQKILSADASVTSTTNVNLTSLNMSVNVAGPSDVVWINLDATVLISGAGTLNTLELLIDGVADSKVLHTSTSGTGRLSGHKEWRITGLAAGSHTIAFRSRNSAAATSATIAGSFTSANYQTTT